MNAGIFWMVDSSFGWLVWIIWIGLVSWTDWIGFRRVAKGTEWAYGQSTLMQFTSNLQGGCKKKQDEPNLQLGNCLEEETEKDRAD